MTKINLDVVGWLKRFGRYKFSNMIKAPKHQLWRRRWLDASFATSVWWKSWKQRGTLLVAISDIFSLVIRVQAMKKNVHETASL